MIRQTTKYFVDKAIEDELHYAVTERPMFHSDHEAWAILNEELEEAWIEYMSAEDIHVLMWDAIKADEHEEVLKQRDEMLKKIELAIAELVQCAAMLEKFDMRKGKEE